jgi:hypothetical protein
MKRIIAIAALLGSLGVLLKLGGKRPEADVRALGPDLAEVPDPAEVATATRATRSWSIGSSNGSAITRWRSSGPTASGA